MFTYVHLFFLQATLRTLVLVRSLISSWTLFKSMFHSIGSSDEHKLQWHFQQLQYQSYRFWSEVMNEFFKRVPDLTAPVPPLPAPESDESPVWSQLKITKQNAPKMTKARLQFAGKVCGRARHTNESEQLQSFFWLNSIARLPNVMSIFWAPRIQAPLWRICCLFRPP